MWFSCNLTRQFCCCCRRFSTPLNLEHLEFSTRAYCTKVADWVAKTADAASHPKSMEEQLLRDYEEGIAGLVVCCTNGQQVKRIHTLLSDRQCVKIIGEETDYAKQLEDLQRFNDGKVSPISQ